MFKMRSVVILVVVFLCIVLLPLLVNQGRTVEAVTSDLSTPEIQELPEQQCIESTEYMRIEHMHLLDSWRTEVLRNGATDYISSTGQVYDMSLEETCFSCHSNKAEFCKSCHDYVAVDPDCWNCHDGGETVGGS